MNIPQWSGDRFVEVDFLDCGPYICRCRPSMLVTVKLYFEILSMAPTRDWDTGCSSNLGTDFILLWYFSVIPYLQVQFFGF